MSRIAVAVSRRIASESTSRKVRPPGPPTGDTPSSESFRNVVVS